MADVFNKKKRSWVMSQIKGSENKTTELALIKLFRYYGIKGWRRKIKLPGSPDFIFPKETVAVFSDGCFWHGHECRNIKPSNNRKFWSEKIEANRRRDKRVNRKLRRLGWSVFRLRECSIKKGKIPTRLISKFRQNENYETGRI